MRWVELKPGKAGAERVTVGVTKRGTICVGLGAAVAERNKLRSGGKVRVMADLESSPRMLRIVVDAAGQFAFRQGRGGSGVVAVPPLSGLSHIRFDKVEAEWDECTDEKGRPAINIELPKALQVPEKPVEPPELVRPNRPPLAQLPITRGR